MSAPESQRLKDAMGSGPGVVFGSPGVYHYPVAHEYVPSCQAGFGITVGTLCGRSGLLYAESLRGLWPHDRLCKQCERAADRA